MVKHIKTTTHASTGRKLATFALLNAEGYETNRTHVEVCARKGAPVVKIEDAKAKASALLTAQNRMVTL